MGTALSTLDPNKAARFEALGCANTEIKVPVTTLDILLAEHAAPSQQIHLLEIDIEDFEQQTLEGLDLSVWRVGWWSTQLSRCRRFVITTSGKPYSPITGVDASSSTG